MKKCDSFDSEESGDKWPPSSKLLKEQHVEYQPLSPVKEEVSFLGLTRLDVQIEINVLYFLLQKYPNRNGFGGYKYEGFVPVVDKAVDKTWPAPVDNARQYTLSRGTCFTF